ncbi:MAG: DNA repair protein RecN [Desulfobacterales bacterium]|nr:DNA repair protein RecN [Desulfobacterales bacterium]
MGAGSLNSTMLIHFNITNFAIIKRLELTLNPGLNILSGETGAGKSIIINAVNLILGGRASADLIRSGCNEAGVEALFSFPENRLLNEMLTDLGISFDKDLLIKRTVFREGRNKILINGSMATLQMLSRLGASLLSISGQHEHQLLLRPDNHLYLLDDFAGLADERLELTGAFKGYQALNDKIDRLEKEISDMGDRQDLTRFQIQEIEAAEFSPGEDERLLEEKKRLQHAEELLEIVSESYQLLYETGDSAGSSISGCTKRIDRGTDIDPRLGVIRDALAEIEIKLEDASFALRDFQKTIDMDPNTLEQVVERLEVLNALKRKYGPSLEDVVRFRDKLGAMMFDLDEKKERLGQVEKERYESATKITARAKKLSEKRKKSAKVLEKAVEKELHKLHMKETRFQIQFDKAPDGQPTGQGETEDAHIKGIGADGLDRVEFMISPNVGEELKPLSRIASGGELSRILLALRTILARTSSVETIIFDEVDSGISGATAEVVGEKLFSLAGYHQILCITHLPQIASQGQTHFLVAKEVHEGRTQTMVLELDPDERVQEIARLLGGQEITPRAIAHAREMLG